MRRKDAQDDYLKMKISSAVGELTATRAEPGEIEDFLRVLEETEQWFASKDIKQWPLGANRLHAKFYEEEIRRGVVHFIRREDEIVAALIFGPPSWLDKKLWDELSEDALYVHRFCVRRAFAGKGVGRDILRWAEEVAAARGKQYLRLNCQSNNSVICQYFENAGFSDEGRVEGQGWTVNLYEKQVG